MLTACVGALSSVRSRITSQLYAPCTYSGCILTLRDTHHCNSLFKMQATVGAGGTEPGHQAEQSRCHDCDESHGTHHGCRYWLLWACTPASHTHMYTHINTLLLLVVGSRDQDPCIFPTAFIKGWEEGMQLQLPFSMTAVVALCYCWSTLVAQRICLENIWHAIFRVAVPEGILSLADMNGIWLWHSCCEQPFACWAVHTKCQHPLCQRKQLSFR